LATELAKSECTEIRRSQTLAPGLAFWRRPGTRQELVWPRFLGQTEKEPDTVTSTQAWLQSTRSDQDLDEADKECFVSLRRNGQMDSAGSMEHPTSCSPCSFYCFSNRGCKKGRTCQYCHMLHITRANRHKKKKTPTGTGE
jgi:hypothetical protein